MSKKPKLTDIVEDLEFCPTDAMRAAKSAFWAIGKDSPLVDPAEVSLATVQQISPDGRLNRWWGTPGFSEWFTNQQEWRQRIEYLFNVGLDAVEEVFRDEEAPPTAKIRAFEIMARLTEKEPAKVTEVRYHDAQINNMNAQQLKAWLERQGYTKELTNGKEED
jgi:hypothetical protein